MKAERCREEDRYYTEKEKLEKNLRPAPPFLKGPKHEIFESGFFTEIRPVRIGDLGTGEKK
jgi:hypothetical protein